MENGYYYYYDYNYYLSITSTTGVGSYPLDLFVKIYVRKFSITRIICEKYSEDPLKINVVLELVVNRHNLLNSVKNSLRNIIEDDISTLMLPLT